LNGEKYLREAIDSVFSQSYPHWEIVFWDNAGSDESGAIAKSYGEKIRYFRSESTTTLGMARNMAFSQCKGEYVAILDADDVWLPSKMERQVRLFMADAEVALVFCNSLFFDDCGDHENSFMRVQPRRGHVFPHLLRRNFISSETMMFRKRALDSIHPLFHDDLSMVIDYDLSLRVAYYHKLDFVDECLSKWRMDPDSESHRKRALIYKEKRIMIERLKKCLPLVIDRYEEDIKASNHRNDFRMGIEAWKNGQVAEARKCFRGNLGRNAISTMLYLGTMIYPFSLPNMVLSLAEDALINLGLMKKVTF